MEKDTIYSGIIGAAVADALGVPYEFCSRSKMKKHPATTMTGHGMYNQPVGTWSDDTSLTLATIDSITNSINLEDMMKKFCQWYLESKYTANGVVFDIGVTTREALENHIQYNIRATRCGLNGKRDNGNGSLMRILPITLYNHAKELTMKEQIKLIDSVSSLTHAHPISKASCNIYNMIIQEILNNKECDLKELIHRGIDRSRRYYENSMYPCFENLYNHVLECEEDELFSMGYVVNSLEVAVYCSYHSSSYSSSVLKAVNFGGDTDTNAMITGGLTGLYYGISSIPCEWMKKTAKIDFVKSLCDRFYESL